MIADLQRPKANDSVETCQGRKFVAELQWIVVVARDELYDAREKQMVEAIKSRPPIDSSITAGAKVFLDTKDLPIIYANVNPTRLNLVHR